MFDQVYRQIAPIKHLAQIHLIGLLTGFLFAVMLFCWYKFNPKLDPCFFSLPERERKEGGLSTSLPVKLELRYDDENTLPLMPRRWRLCSIWT